MVVSDTERKVPYEELVSLDRVQEAGEESFPASDAPAWNPICGLGPPARRMPETSAMAARSMISQQLLPAEGILVLAPSGPVEATDFQLMAKQVDAYIKQHGNLTGVLIHATELPGWANLEAVLADVRFIERHQQKVQRLAVVGDSEALKEMPEIFGRRVHPEVRCFAESAHDEALRWLRGLASAA